MHLTLAGEKFAFCGPVGVGSMLCFKPGCTVKSHKKNRSNASVGPGARIEVKNGLVLASPFISEARFDAFKSSLSPILVGYHPRETLTAILRTIAKLGDSNMTMEEQREEVVRVLTTTRKRPLGLTPMKSARFAAAAEDTSGTTSEKAIEMVMALKSELNEVIIDQRGLEGQDGTTTSVPPLDDWMDAVDGELEKVNNQHVEAEAAHEARAKKTDESLAKQTMRLGQHESKILKSESKQALQKEITAKLLTLVEALKTQVGQGGGNLMGGGQGMTSISSVDASLVKALRENVELLQGCVADLSAEVASVKNANYEFSLDGGTILLNGKQDFEALIDGVPENRPHLFAFDPNYVLTRLGKAVTTEAEVRDKELHEAKVQRASAYTKLIASQMSMAPPMLTKSRKSADEDDLDESARLTLAAIDTYAKFNPKTGMGGVMLGIVRGLPSVVKKLEQEIDTGLKFQPAAKGFAKKMLANSVTFIKSLLAFLNEQYDKLLANCHGDGGEAYSATAKKEVWNLCLLMAVVIFETLWETRSDAASAHEDPASANMVYLEATVRTHAVMESFLSKDFSEHPCILPKMFRHIFESFVSKSDFDTMKEEVKVAKMMASNAKRSYDSMNARLMKLETGGGAGVQTAAQKRRLKKGSAVKMSYDDADEDE